MVDSKLEQKEEDIQKLIYLAWHIEAFRRQKRLPKLKTLFKKKNKNLNKTSGRKELIEIAKNKGLSGPWDKR